MKKTAFKFLFSFVFGLFLLEILLRFFWLVPVTAKGAFFRRDDVADHSHYAYGDGRMVTGEFDVILHMNNIGMRDDHVVIPKPAGEKRLLVLGDSFMEGWGVQRGEMFTDRLEVELKKHDPDINVVAAGTSSWSTLTELAWLRHNGLDLEIDAVILALDTTDPAGDSFYVHRLVRDDLGRPSHISWPERKFDLPKGLHDLFGKYSYTYRYIDRFLTKKLHKTKWDYGYWADGDDVWAPTRSDLSDTDYDSYWRYTKEGLLTIDELLGEQDIPWFFFMYPTGAETDTDAWRGRVTADFETGVIVPPRRFEYVDAFAKSNALPYVSLLDTFQNDSEPARLFLDWDGHWSPAGHEKAAEAVALEVIEKFGYAAFSL